jgi:hypothetical protein
MRSLPQTCCHLLELDSICCRGALYQPVEKAPDGIIVGHGRLVIKGNVTLTEYVLAIATPTKDCAVHIKRGPVMDMDLQRLVTQPAVTAGCWNADGRVPSQGKR